MPLTGTPTVLRLRPDAQCLFWDLAENVPLQSGCRVVGGVYV
ncbi:hypothetical protein [Acetobacter indonesiensis]